MMKRSVLATFALFSRLSVKQIVLGSLFFSMPFICGYCAGLSAGLVLGGAFLGLEALSYVLVHSCRRVFPWLITPKDFFPVIDRDGLGRFVDFGFDSELGWVRKPNTWKSEIGQNGIATKFRIDADGSRANPRHEELPKGGIAIYGDSFAFSRQVNDNESIQWYLSALTHTNIRNFSVGNYGLDQALLRFMRESATFPAKVTVLGLVPSTIVRIHDIWKHYNEFGNIYGFKPRFFLRQDGTLEFFANPARSFNDIIGYRRLLPDIQSRDLFYRRKFLKEMIRFPYLFHIFAQPMRNIDLLYLITRDRAARGKEVERHRPYPLPMKVIMRINLKLRRHLFMEKKSLALLQALTLRFAQECSERGTKPVMLWMPQKDDVQYIRRTGDCYYHHYVEWARRKLLFIDATPTLVSVKDLSEYYCDDTDYGGHFSPTANRMIADLMVRELGKEGSTLCENAVMG